MKNTSEVTALICDNGANVAWARKLGETFKKVYYYVFNISEAPKMDKSRIGEGYPEIEVVQNIFGDHFDECDLVCFPDVGEAELQLHIESLGKAVWGSRMAAELETEREGTKELLKEVGLTVGSYDIITGIDALREYLRKHEDIFVKISDWRGSFESFRSSDYPEIETDIDDICYGLGMFKYSTNFVCEKALPDKIEIGCDMFTVDGKFPSELLVGVEVKDLGYAGVFKKYSEFPKPLMEINDKLSKQLKEWGARCDMTTEARIGKDKIAYPIDFTMRRPSPPGELQLEFYTNLAEIVWQGANGKLIDPVPAAKCGVQVAIVSDNGRHKKWQSISYDEEYSEYIKLHNSVKINGRNYIVPSDWELAEIGGVIGFGNSIDEACKMAIEVAETVHGPTLKIDAQNVLADAEEALEEADKMGMGIT